MNKTTTQIALMAATLLATACASESKGTSSQDSPGDKTATTKSSATKPSEDNTTEPVPSIDSLLSEYETVRARLTNDSSEGISDAAKRIESIATALAANAPADARPHLSAAGAAAGKLAAVDSGDMAGLRIAFGEVSKSLVALRDVSPELAAGSHVFECPMAKGYKRWIQPDEKLQNPYMGQKMPACGSEVTGSE